MIKRLALAGLLLAGGAQAQTISGGAASAIAPNTPVANAGAIATGQAGTRPLANWFGDIPNVKGSTTIGALGTGKIVSDAAITSGGITLTSATAGFTAGDVGKSVVLAGAGSALQLQSAVVAVAGGTVSNPYNPGDTVTLAGGTGTPAVVTVATSQLSVAAINAGGTGYAASSTFDVYVTGSGTCPIPMVVNVTTNGSGVVTSYNSVTNPGQCTVNPTLSSAATTTYLGGAGSGLTLSLGTGPNTVTVSTVGAYTVLPTNPAAQASTTGNGTGATFTAFYSALPLATTITGFTNSTTVTLAATASATTSAQWAVIAPDDSAAFQSAETTACGQNNGLNGGGAKILIPAGIYIVNNVNVTCPTTWEGEGYQGNGNPHSLPWQMGGTTIVHTSQANSAFNVANNGTTQLPSGTRFAHLGLFEIHPADYVGWAPIAYPYFISAVGSEQEEITLDDIMAAPVYNLFSYANGGKFKLNQVHGQIFGTGFNLANIGDISRIDDIHFWPYWLFTANTTLWGQNNADVWVSDSEGFWIDKMFAIDMRAGLHFIGSSHSAQEIHCGVCDFDQVTHAVWVDNLQHTITMQFGSLYMWNATQTLANGTANFYINNPQFSVGAYITVDYLESHYGQPVRIEDGTTNVAFHILSGYLAQTNQGNTGQVSIFAAQRTSAINAGVANLVDISSTLKLQPTNASNLFNTSTNASLFQYNTVPITGVTVGANAPAGAIGQSLAYTVAAGSAIGLSTNSATDITSGPLTPGVWLVWGSCGFNAANTTVVSEESCSVNTSTAQGDPASGNAGRVHTSWTSAGSGFTGGDVVNTTPWLQVVTTTTTYHLVAYSLFTTSTMQIWGKLQAIRIY